MTRTDFHMMSKDKTDVYLVICPPFFELQDRVHADDGGLIATSANTARISTIELISNSQHEGCIISRITFPFQRGEGRELGADFAAGLDALRAAWRAEMAPRALRVELDDEALGKLGAAVARGLHDAAQAEMAAEVAAETGEVYASTQAERAEAGGAYVAEVARKDDTQLARLTDPDLFALAQRAKQIADIFSF